MEDNSLKLFDVCCACLTKSDNMKSLLDNNEEVTNILKKFSAVSNLEIELGLDYPSYLCFSCEDKVNNAFEFQRLCRRSYNQIQKLLTGDKTEVQTDPSSDEADSFESNDAASSSDEFKTVEELNSFKERIYFALQNVRKKLWSHKDCRFCGFSAAKSSYLRVHIARRHKDHENNWCPICNEAFPDLPSHYTKHYNDFKCEFCLQISCTPEDFLEHLQEHLSEYEQEYQCDSCKDIFTDKTLLQLHLKSHSTCNECSKHFCSLDQFDTHDCREEKEPDSTEIPKKNYAGRPLRLKQYSAEDVDKAISQIRETFNRHATCICCNFTATTNRSLSVHMTRVHREMKDVWCSSCNKFVDDLPKHSRVKHSKDLKCPLCQKVASTMSHLMEHVTGHSGKRLYKCKVCHMSFKTPRNLNKHNEIHIKHKQSTRVKCKMCKVVFDQVESYNKHKCFGVQADAYDVVADDKNAIEPQNYCKKCDKKVRSLRLHLKTVHVKSEPVAELKHLCPQCGKQFRTVSKLNMHIRVHTNQKPYKCQYCERRFKTRNILVVHERTHTGEKPYRCSVCGKGFAQSSVLNTHLRIHTGRPEKCKICGKGFCRNAELRLHMRKHTGEKPYSCSHCDQSFTQRSHLVEHTRTHSDERPFKCEYCEKAFKNLGTLRAHLQIHLGQKPYKCSQCPYACRQPYSLTQHMLQHDDDKPQPDNPYNCRICQRGYVTVAHFTAHFNKYHAGSTDKTIEEVMEKHPECDELDDS